jgi:hypothetical protein
MSGGSALPSLSDIETLNVTYLTQLTSDFTAEADLIQNSFTEAHELRRVSTGVAHEQRRRKTRNARAVRGDLGWLGDLPRRAEWRLDQNDHG